MLGGRGGDIQEEQHTMAEHSKADGPVRIPVLVYIPNTQAVAMPVSLGITLLGTEHSRQHWQHADDVTLCIGSCA